MSSDQIQCEVLKRAAEIAGGEDEHAKRLNVKPEDMHEWLQGKATAPAGIYLVALDILLRHAAARSKGRRLTSDSKVKPWIYRKEGQEEKAPARGVKLFLRGFVCERLGDAQRIL